MKNKNSIKIKAAAVGVLLFASIVVPIGASAAPTATTPAPSNAQNKTTDTKTQTPPVTDQNVGAFVPLTQFPQIQTLAAPNSFNNFVNTLYKVCIGAGSVLAVIMIMVAGVQFMTSRGSVASNEKAKARIQNALLGLLLVLAPTIVFGIINPDILKLNFGTEFGDLTPAKVDPNAFTSTGAGVTTQQAAAQFSTVNRDFWINSPEDVPGDTARCNTSGGKISQTCLVGNDTTNNFKPVNGQCSAGQKLVDMCIAPSDAPSTLNACRDKYKDLASLKTIPIKNGSPHGQSCPADTTAIPLGCCGQISPGNLCCMPTPK